MKKRLLVGASRIILTFPLFLSITAEAAEIKVLSAIAMQTDLGRSRAEVRARDRTQGGFHVRQHPHGCETCPRWRNRRCRRRSPPRDRQFRKEWQGGGRQRDCDRQLQGFRRGRSQGRP